MLKKKKNYINFVVFIQNKPFLFHAIEKNDAQLVKILLDEEIDINSKYHVNIGILLFLKIFELNRSLIN